MSHTYQSLLRESEKQITSNNIGDYLPLVTQVVVRKMTRKSGEVTHIVDMQARTLTNYAVRLSFLYDVDFQSTGFYALTGANPHRAKHGEFSIKDDFAGVRAVLDFLKDEITKDQWDDFRVAYGNYAIPLAPIKF